MSELKILYVASEIAPFLSMSNVSQFVGTLAPAIQQKGVDIRILVPRFGVINERKNKLHEVVRLSGAIIKIGHESHHLSIKVAAIPGTRIQVYFIDNDAYFTRKHVFKDLEENFFTDNDERLIFVCKGVLETVKNLNWIPHIVHCHDWITSLIPFYIKTSLKNDPIFQHTKVFFNIYNHAFEEVFDTQFAEKARMIGINDKEIAQLSEGIDFVKLMQIAIKYADYVAKSEKILLPNSKIAWLEEIEFIGNDKAGIDTYYQLYNKLTAKPRKNK